MPILFDCKCGKAIEVENEFAGQEVECPYCTSIVTAPMAMRAKVVRRANSIATKAVEVEEESPKKKSKRRRSRDSDDDSRWGARDKLYDDDAYSQPMAKRWSNPGVVGGIVAMVLAVVWFVCAAIFLDRIYFYPPVLFIGGLLSLLRGLGLLGSNQAESNSFFR